MIAHQDMLEKIGHPAVTAFYAKMIVIFEGLKEKADEEIAVAVRCEADLSEYSYHVSAYPIIVGNGLPITAVVRLYPNSDCSTVAADLVEGILSYAKNNITRGEL